MVIAKILKASVKLKKYSLENMLHFADNSRKSNIKAASSHIIPGFSVPCISVPSPPRNVSGLWT